MIVKHISAYIFSFSHFLSIVSHICLVDQSDSRALFDENQKAIEKNQESKCLAAASPNNHSKKFSIRIDILT